MKVEAVRGQRYFYDLCLPTTLKVQVEETLRSFAAGDGGSSHFRKWGAGRDTSCCWSAPKAGFRTVSFFWSWIGPVNSETGLQENIFLCAMKLSHGLDTEQVLRFSDIESQADGTKVLVPADPQTAVPPCHNRLRKLIEDDSKSLTWCQVWR